MGTADQGTFLRRPLEQRQSCSDCLYAVEVGSNRNFRMWKLEGFAVDDIAPCQKGGAARLKKEGRVSGGMTMVGRMRIPGAIVSPAFVRAGMRLCPNYR